MSSTNDPELPRLYLARSLSRLAASTKPLSAAARRGELVRIRHGVYAAKADWEGLKSWQKYRLRVEAAAETFKSPTVFSKHSAAAVWGVPTIHSGQPVHAVTTFRGGGRSRAGVQRHLVDPKQLEVEERAGLLVTGRAATVLDIAASVPFAEAIVPLDHVLKPDRRNGLPALSKFDLLAALEGRYSPSVERRVRAAIEFANPLSGSAGESYSRGLIHVAGFAAPILQFEVLGMRGSRAYTDFYWDESKTVGEFDGVEKYVKPEYLNGRTTSQAVVDEKVREDRIRATGRHVVRWVWADLKEPARLERQLQEAGVPRRRRASAGHGNGLGTQKRPEDARI